MWLIWSSIVLYLDVINNHRTIFDKKFYNEYKDDQSLETDWQKYPIIQTMIRSSIICCFMGAFNDLLQNQSLPESINELWSMWSKWHGWWSDQCVQSHQFDLITNWHSLVVATIWIASLRGERDLMWWREQKKCGVPWRERWYHGGAIEEVWRAIGRERVRY